MTELAVPPRADHTAPEQGLTLTVADNETIADRVVELTLRHPGGVDLPAWSPGAHIDVHLGEGLVRQYSLCGDPGRTRASMAFRDELAADHPGRVVLCPQDECGLLDLASLLGEPHADTLVYCCGPEPLLAAVERACGGWPAGALHVERFSAKPLDPADTAGDITHEVEFRASGITVEVPPDTSILEAAERAGLPVESSCHEGICGTCEVAVLEGEPVHRDAVLSAAERDSGEVMMICCSRARSRRLVLDL
jgi:ferredoxin-NADP reductase